MESVFTSMAVALFGTLVIMLIASVTTLAIVLFSFKMSERLNDETKRC